MVSELDIIILCSTFIADQRISTMDHLVKFSLLLLFCISFATAVDKDVSEKDINVKISGKSGKMRLGRSKRIMSEQS